VSVKLNASQAANPEREKTPLVFEASELAFDRGVLRVDVRRRPAPGDLQIQPAAVVAQAALLVRSSGLGNETARALARSGSRASEDDTQLSAQNLVDPRVSSCQLNARGVKLFDCVVHVSILKPE
jgi:hypothetical protein